MPESPVPLLLATRGSPLALAQARTIRSACAAAFPDLRFELRIVKTTGDRLQRASMATPAEGLPKGLFTKELESALLEPSADFAVHSLKDLPTDLPDGLELGAVSARADVRDVLVYRPRGGTPGAPAGPAEPAGGDLQPLESVLPPGATVATSSTRRRAQLLAQRPDLAVVEIRGNVGTRLRKVSEEPGLDATVLAAAGLQRLGIAIGPDGRPGWADPKDGSADRAPLPQNLRACYLPVELMLPCVGQAAIGIEVRTGDAVAARVCAALNHMPTFWCVTAERAFLRAMGGGCQSPVAAYAELADDRLRVRAVSFRTGQATRAEISGPPEQAEALGRDLAQAILASAGG